MAEKSGFFNSINGDRRYKADFFAEYFSSFIGNGVFPNPSNALQVIASTNMSIIVKAGKAWINGYYYNNDTDLTLTLDTADGVLNRIDRVVLQFNTLNRAITAEIKKGVFASNAVVPALQRDSNAYELALADIYIGKGILDITQSNITDLRLDNSKCGIVHGTIEQVDTTTLFNQYQTWLSEKKVSYDTDMTNWTTQKKAEYEGWVAETNTLNQNQFNAWFNGIQSVFEGDAVGNLTNKVNEIPVFQIAQGTATAITLNEFTLTNGNSKTFIVNANNSGAATTINGLPLYKPNTTISPTLAKGKAVTVWFDLVKNCFFIKASAEGSALASQVLAGVPFSNDDDTGIIGTMPNYSNSTISTAGESSIITIIDNFVGSGNSMYGTISHKLKAAGYMNGETVVKQNVQGLNPAVVKAGQPIGNAALNITGTFTSDATATAGQMLAGATGYVNGSKVTGTIPSKAAATITPGVSNQTISSGQYLSGAQTISGSPSLVASNIKNGVSIFGVTGNVTVESLGGTYMQVYKSATYQYASNSVAIDEAGYVYVLATNGTLGYIYKLDPKLNLISQTSWTRSSWSIAFIKYDKFTNLLYVNQGLNGATGEGWYDTNLNYIGATYRTNRTLTHFDQTVCVLDEVTGDIYKVTHGTNAVINRIDINGSLVYQSSVANMFQSSTTGLLSAALSTNQIWMFDSGSTDSYWMQFNKSDGTLISKTKFASYYAMGVYGNGTTDFVYRAGRYSSSTASGAWCYKENGTGFGIVNTGRSLHGFFGPSGRTAFIACGDSEGTYPLATFIQDGNVTGLGTPYPFAMQYTEGRQYTGPSMNTNNEMVFVTKEKAIMKIKI